MEDGAGRGHDHWLDPALGLSYDVAIPILLSKEPYLDLEAHSLMLLGLLILPCHLLLFVI